MSYYGNDGEYGDSQGNQFSNYHAGDGNDGGPDYYQKTQGGLYTEFPEYFGSGYMASAGSYMIMGETMMICAAIMFLSLMIIGCIKRRQRSRANADEQAAYAARLHALVYGEEEVKVFDPESGLPVDVLGTDDDSVGPSMNELIPTAGDVLGGKSDLHHEEKRLLGWSEIVMNSIEKDTHLDVRPIAPEDAHAESILQKDLFEQGGFVHQMHHFQELTDSQQVRNESQPVEGASAVTGATTTGDYIMMTDDIQEEVNTSSCGYIRALLRMDKEMRKLLKLAIPWSLSSVITSALSLMIIACIGKMLGTADQSGYMMVYYGLEITTMFLSGLESAITSLCSQAIGAENYTRAGQYIQIAVLSYLILFIPQIYIWWNYFYDFMIWMEFDEETAAKGHRYMHIYLMHFVFSSFPEGINYLLELSGHEKFVSSLSVIEYLLDFCITFGVLWYGFFPYYGEPTLELIGMLDLVIGVIMFLIEMYIIGRYGWLDNYWEGLLGSCALFQWNPVYTYFKAAIPLSVGYILSYGEWEVMFLLASHLGPAEVATWALLGSIWSALEGITYAWGSAAEVRCSKLLGSSEPEKAELAGYKAMLFGFLGSCVLSGGLLATSNYLPSWLTNDTVLQTMLIQALPLIAVANVALAMGTVSWQLISAQGRYTLGTAIELLGSWGITIPLAFLSTFILDWHLEGLVAAIVIGCMVTGSVNYIIVRCTNWPRLSAKIVKRNEGKHDQVGNPSNPGLFLEKGTVSSPGTETLQSATTENSATSTAVVKDKKTDNFLSAPIPGVAPVPVADRETEDLLSAQATGISPTAVSGNITSETAIGEVPEDQLSAQATGISPTAVSEEVPGSITSETALGEVPAASGVPETRTAEFQAPEKPSSPQVDSQLTKDLISALANVGIATDGIGLGSSAPTVADEEKEEVAPATTTLDSDGSVPTPSGLLAPSENTTQDVSASPDVPGGISNTIATLPKPTTTTDLEPNPSTNSMSYIRDWMADMDSTDALPIDTVVDEPMVEGGSEMPLADGFFDASQNDEHGTSESEQERTSVVGSNLEGESLPEAKQQTAESAQSMVSTSSDDEN